ncbi:alpha/beta hydrolase [Nocardioides sp. R-C-SC26]|uniref:alpha/beta hydrolase n=1 Tax=Nocardioides sp. R-C-SC26 TaxID=2870414 RepID=UPI001E37705D|nr:alpha/beta hydrolase [Nocardioides sp. R-C-SC26]
MGFRRRQAVIAALTANAVRPVPGFRTGIPAFFAGWLTGELAPHLLTLTAADAAAHATGRRRDVAGLALAGASAAGLGYLISQSRRTGDDVEEALVEGIGVDYVEQLDAKPTPADLAIPWRRVARPFSMRDKSVRVVRDVTYSEFGKRGKLDLFLPPDEAISDAPVLVQVHGGGWTIGTKEQQGQQLMHHLAAKGWICVAINYRLSPRSAWPAHIVDVKRALAWVQENIAEYGGDPGYVAITGGSAGGHLCALAALTPNDPAWQPGFEDADTTVQCCVPHYGVYDMAGSTGMKSAVQLRDLFLAPRIFKTTWEADPEVFEQASPILRITPDAPDFFVLHGAFDTLVPVDQARMFVERLRAVGKRSVVYAELPGAQHAFDVFGSIRSAHVVRAIDRYLHWHWNGYRRESATPAR